MAVTLPIINGSTGVWGSILNTAITDIDNRLVAATSRNDDQDTAIAALNTKVAALEGAIGGIGSIKTFTSGTRPTPTTGAVGLEIDTGYLLYGARVSGVATWVPWPGSFMARLRQTVAQSIPSSTGTNITLNTADFNRLSGWTGGSRFTAPIAGTYEFTGAISFAGNATGYRSALWKINTAYAFDSGQNGSPAGGSATVAVARPFIIALQPGGFVELTAYQTSGAALLTDVGNTLQTGMQVKYLGYNGS